MAAVPLPLIALGAFAAAGGTAAYYVVSESLANAGKHVAASGASSTKD
ncbi:hypothetical protein G5C51_31515 [Streptomyces sp. A7024]|uniref:Uncharacterized protein n=1 Tax=Streptomyces coryli TaxID=1128680 RepID=A0A6G4U899_9ACTN|nr:hypothetical protein [Streptomyces coryli]NGN68414.1 hypothetical protein [Streptomyces coryli]